MAGVVTAQAPVPPLGGHPLLVFLLQAGVLLLLAVLLGRLAVRCKMPAVVGELCAGLLLGPSVLTQVTPGLAAWLVPQRVDQFQLLDAIGQVGVLLLVGVTGANLDLSLVRSRMRAAAATSGFGLVVPLALGIAAGLLIPMPSSQGGQVVFALFLGVAMCVSAIPVIARTLMDMDLLHRDVGQLTLTAAMIDDTFGWLMLSVVSAMATSGVWASDVALSAALLAAIVLVAFFVGRPLVRGVFKLLTRSTDATTIAAVVVLIVLCAAGTQALGFEAILGAFICGILITECGRPDPRRLAPLRTVVVAVLAPLFLATAGLRMNLTALADIGTLLLALALLAIAIIGKFSGVYLGARISRLSKWEALALGAGMNARGVIEVIVAMVGLRLGVLNTAIYTIIVLIAVITSLMSPPILRFAMARVDQTAAEDARRRSLG
jgi:Kef-type K+ transport system membrane component KefB